MTTLCLGKHTWPGYIWQHCSAAIFTNTRRCLSWNLEGRVAILGYLDQKIKWENQLAPQGFRRPLVEPPLVGDLGSPLCLWEQKPRTDFKRWAINVDVMRSSLGIPPTADYLGFPLCLWEQKPRTDFKRWAIIVHCSIARMGACSTTEDHRGKGAVVTKTEFWENAKSNFKSSDYESNKLYWLKCCLLLKFTYLGVAMCILKKHEMIFMVKN